jgi:hypothetical protein
MAFAGTAVGAMTRRRESTTHGPRLDEQLKRETEPLLHGSHAESRAAEERELEGAGDDEPRAELDGAVGLSREPELARRELSRHLRPRVFPARRDELIAEAEENNAPDAVLELLMALPNEVAFETVYEVWDAVGGELEEAERDVVAKRMSHPDDERGSRA